MDQQPALPVGGDLVNTESGPGRTTGIVGLTLESAPRSTVATMAGTTELAIRTVAPPSGAVAPPSRALAPPSRALAPRSGTVARLRVGELAEAVGVRADTVRYYERIGLLPAPARTSSGYRAYGPLAVERMRFIQGAQRIGLTLTDIRDLLAIRDTGTCPCEPAEGLLHRRLTDLDAQLARLHALRAEMVAMLTRLPTAKCPPLTPGAWCPPEDGTMCPPEDGTMCPPEDGTLRPPEEGR
jgi:DNA-binding transcriptional MerR regulator